MKSKALKLSVVIVLGLWAAGRPVAPQAAAVEAAPAFESIGPMSFGAVSGGDVLFAADPQAATIYAVDLGASAAGATAGTKAIAGIDQKIAAILGSTPADIAITDLAVHPKSHNAFISVMRGQGANAKPALVRVDGAGTLTVVDLAQLKATKVALPNAPSATPAAAGRQSARSQSVTDMAYVNGKLYVAGLSNEEFASKLRAISYPFTTADNGTSVEIFHGSHGAFETRSPVYTFVPFKTGATENLIAGYLCTPLVRFPVSSLTPGAKVMGTTIAELGAGNRPIDMILYSKDGQQFLLMANTNRGVMKIPTADFGTNKAITAPVQDKAGIGYETIASMQGTQQLDLLDAAHTLAITRAGSGLDLQTAALP
jgi:hypothetical protein